MSPYDELDVVGVGNAIVDVIAHADDRFLVEYGMTKGAMMLIDEQQAERIYGEMGSAVITSGGSAGNTIAGIASLGGKTGFIGKVRDDLLGRAFRHDITAVGAVFPTAPARYGPATARCLILVTPDAQRTMNTYLGASVNLAPEDVDPDFVRAAKVTYMEGYVYDPPLAQEAVRLAAGIAHEAGRKVSLALSDVFCVERHRDAFLDLVHHHIDLLFANEAEIKALYRTDDLDVALRLVRSATAIAAITRGPRGSIVLAEGSTLEIEAAPVERVVDTTGAGDLYAGGFLYGLTNGASPAACGRLGSLAAAEIISHVGARPETPLREYVAAAQPF